MTVKGALDDCPIIAAVKNDDTLTECIESNVNVVFVLYGTVNSIAGIVSALKAAGKIVFVHIDLIEGLSSREAAVDFLINSTDLDGIISTKVQLIRYAKSKNMLTVMRFFVIDSMALANVTKVKGDRSVDFIEIMPGVMPKIIKNICFEEKKKIIAGGLINDKADICSALDAGAVAVSATNPRVWNL